MNAAGEELASIPGEAVVYKEGDTIIDADGNERKFGKTTAGGGAGGGGKVYTSKTLPGGVRTDLIKRLEHGTDDAGNPLTMSTLMQTYGEVDQETLQNFFDEYGPSEGGGGGGLLSGVFGNWLSEFGD